MYARVFDTAMGSQCAPADVMQKHSPFIIKQSENSISTKLSSAPCSERKHWGRAGNVCARPRAPLLSAHHNKSVVIFIIHYFSVGNARICFGCLHAVAGPSVFRTFSGAFSSQSFAVQKVGRSSDSVLMLLYP